MKRETIIENCERVISFFKMEKKLNFEAYINSEPFSILKAYGLLLDINGAPVRNLSVLYISDINEFNELKMWCQSNCIDSFYENHPPELSEEFKKNKDARAFPMYFSFRYEGYYWEIINR